MKMFRKLSRYREDRCVIAKRKDGRPGAQNPRDFPSGATIQKVFFRPGALNQRAFTVKGCKPKRFSH